MEEVVLQQPLPIKGWDDLIGHSQERLKLAQGGAFPSLLFSGPEGLGKRWLACWLAAHRNCQQPPLQPPWHCTCPNCALVLKNQHPDIYWMERVPGKLSLGVAEARELIHQLYLRPYRAQTRVCIVSEAERLTEEAQSALLKTLEEPPEGNLLVLVTHQESRLLPTVQSRCRIHRFRPLEDSEVSHWLHLQGIPEEQCQLLTRLSQGCPGQAQRLSQMPGLLEARNQLLDLVLQCPASSLGQCLELAGRCESLKVPGLEGRGQVEWVLEQVQVVARDLLLLSSGVERLVNLDVQERMQQLLDQGLSGATMVEVVQEAREYCQANVNTRLLLQDLFLKIRKAGKALPK